MRACVRVNIELIFSAGLGSREVPGTSACTGEHAHRNPVTTFACAEQGTYPSQAPVSRPASLPHAPLMQAHTRKKSPCHRCHDTPVVPTTLHEPTASSRAHLNGPSGNLWGAPAGRGAEYRLWSVFRIPTSYLDVPEPSGRVSRSNIPRPSNGNTTAGARLRRRRA